MSEYQANIAPIAPHSADGAQDAPKEVPEAAPITENDIGEYREQDRYLPVRIATPLRRRNAYSYIRPAQIANVSRIMKNSVPSTAKIAKDAKECVQECVSEFISFITSEAAEKCQLEKRKTIGGEDILYAMSSLGFEQYSETLKIHLVKLRQVRLLRPSHLRFLRVLTSTCRSIRPRHPTPKLPRRWSSTMTSDLSCFILCTSRFDSCVCTDSHVLVVMLYPSAHGRISAAPFVTRMKAVFLHQGYGMVQMSGRASASDRACCHDMVTTIRDVLRVWGTPFHNREITPLRH